MERWDWEIHQLIRELEQDIPKNYAFIINDDNYNIPLLSKTTNSINTRSSAIGSVVDKYNNNESVSLLSYDYHQHRRILRRLDRILEEIESYLVTGQQQQGEGGEEQWMDSQSPMMMNMMVQPTVTNTSNNNQDTNKRYQNVLSSSTSSSTTSTTLSFLRSKQQHHQEQKAPLSVTKTSMMGGKNIMYDNTNILEGAAISSSSLQLQISISLRTNLIYIITRLIIPKQQPYQQNNNHQTSLQQQQHTDNNNNNMLLIIGPIAISIIKRISNILFSSSSLHDENNNLNELQSPQEQSHKSTNTTTSNSNIELSYHDIEILFQQLMDHNYTNTSNNTYTNQNTSFERSNSDIATSIWLSLLMKYYMDLYDDHDNDNHHDHDHYNNNNNTINNLHIIIPYLTLFLPIGQQILVQIQPSQILSLSYMACNNDHYHQEERQQQWQILIGYMIQSLVQLYYQQCNNINYNSSIIIKPEQWLLEYYCIPSNTISFNRIDPSNTSLFEKNLQQVQNLLLNWSKYIIELIEYTIDLIDYATTTTTMNQEQLIPYLTICLKLLTTMDVWCTSITTNNDTNQNETIVNSNNKYTIMINTNLISLKVIYQQQLLHLWNTLATSFFHQNQNNNTGSDQNNQENTYNLEEHDKISNFPYQLCYYQLQLTELVLSHITSTTTTPTTHNEHQPLSTTCIPKQYFVYESTIVLIFLRGLEYPELLLQSNQLWLYLEQRIIQQQQEEEELTIQNHDQAQSQQLDESSMNPIHIDKQQKQKQSSLKRILQATTLTFIKQHMIQVQKEDIEYMQYQQLVFNDNNIHNNNNNIDIPYDGNIMYRTILDRLIYILMISNRNNNNNVTETNMYSDPWDQFFWKTIQPIMIH